MNKTTEYLSPIIKTFNHRFNEELDKLVKKDWRIGHLRYEEIIGEGYNLFLLVESKDISSFLDYFRGCIYYSGDFKCGKYHMLVIKLPKSYYTTVDRFKESKYSEMYNKRDISKLFKQFVGGRPNPTFYILSKDKRHEKKFQEVLQKKFNLDFIPDVSEREWDLPIQIKREIWEE